MPKATRPFFCGIKTTVEKATGVIKTIVQVIVTNIFQMSLCVDKELGITAGGTTFVPFTEQK
jgi:hypothetical protein